MRKRFLFFCFALAAPLLGNEIFIQPDTYYHPSHYFCYPDENRWSISADFLWWQAQEGGTDWAYSLDSQTVAPIDRGFNESVDFPWNPGFRIGVDFTCACAGWDTALYYTWYRTSFHDSISNPFGPDDIISGVEPLQSDAQVSNDGEINWNILYSMFDYEIGCNFQPARILSLRPRIGIKGGWIKQNVRMTFNTLFVDTLRVKKRNHFKGIGPSGGVDTTWHIGNIAGHCFSLEGDFGGAMLWGHFNVIEDEIEAGLILQRENLNKNLIVPAIDVLLGFNWETFYNKCRCTFNLSYEIQYWFRQNQMIVFYPTIEPILFATIYRYQRLSEDLRFHGLTAHFSFDF